MSLDPKSLTPGVLNPAAENAFTRGACGALAIAMHDATGWPIVAITDHHNVYGDKAGGGSALHWVVRRPDGMLVDVDGAHDPDELLERYHDEADDGTAAIGTSTRADAMEWYQEGSGSAIPLKLAATFVQAVIERAARPAVPSTEGEEDGPEP